MSSIALSKELLSLLFADRVEHHFYWSLSLCSCKVTMRWHLSRFLIFSSCFPPFLLFFFCWLNMHLYWNIVLVLLSFTMSYSFIIFSENPFFICSISCSLQLMHFAINHHRTKLTSLDLSLNSIDPDRITLSSVLQLESFSLRELREIIKTASNVAYFRRS